METVLINITPEAVELDIFQQVTEVFVGTKGPAGPPGADGQDGAEGLSAYEIAVNNGFVGTEAEWLLSLQGEPGETGPAGPSEWGGIGGDIRTQIDLMQEFRFHIRMPGWRHLNAIGHDGEFGILGRSFLDVTGTAAFNDNFSRWALVVPDFSKQITGVRWWQTVQGTSTTADRNGVAIYQGSIGSSVVNLVADTPEVGMSFWINPANTMVTKLFNAPVTLTPFTIYYVVGVFCCDVLNTPPSLGIIAGTQGNPLTSFAYTNGHRAAFTRALASTPPTVDISVSAATSNAVMFFELF